MLKSRSIPELERVGFLEDVSLRQCPHATRIYVTYPAQKGPQPCIVELSEKDGSIKRVDALTILPSDPPESAVEVESNLAHLLSLIRSAQRATIARMGKGVELRAWSDANWDEPPYCSQKPNAWTPPLFHIGAVSVDSEGKWQLRKLREKDDYYKVASPEENWWLIERWADWENDKLIARKRYEAFHTNFGRDATFLDGTHYKKRMNAFRKQCSFLRLKCSVKEGKQEAAEFRRVLELQRKLREDGEQIPS